MRHNRNQYTGLQIIILNNLDVAVRHGSRQVTYTCCSCSILTQRDSLYMNMPNVSDNVMRHVEHAR